MFLSLLPLRADDAIDEKLMGIANTLTKAEKVSDITGHFKKYKLGSRELVRVYAYWLMGHIDYDCQRFQSGRVEDLETPVLLAEKRAVCYGYSKLFNEMCNSSGIHCYMVKGIAKGLNFNNAEIPTEANHSWNVLKLDSQYYLFDITWAAGAVEKQGNQYRFLRQYDASMLFADPEEFVKKHMPFLPWFQLKSPTTSVAQFFGKEKLPGRRDLSHESITVNYTEKMDYLDGLDYVRRNKVIIDEGEKYFSRPEGSATEMSYLAYQLIQRDKTQENLKLAESMFLLAQGYLKKLPGYAKTATWTNLQQNLEYCRFYLKE